MTTRQLISTPYGDRFGYTGLPFIRNPKAPVYSEVPEAGILLLGIRASNGTWDPEDYFYDCLDEVYAFETEQGVVGLARYDLGEAQLVGYTLVTFEEWQSRNTRPAFANMTFEEFRQALDDADLPRSALVTVVPINLVMQCA